MMRIPLSGALLALVGLGGSLSALDIERVEVHGFVSQGFLDTNRNEFVADSDEGTFAFGETALNVMAEPIERLRVGAQLFARRFGDNDANDDIVLDWAYGDYRLHDLVGIRLGKIKLPKGLFNEIQDIDAARTSILLPQAVYDTHLRDFWTSLIGGSIYGSTPSSAVGSADYQAWYGSVNAPSDGTTADYYGGADGDTEIDVGDVWGAQLVWNTPVPGLRLSGTYSHFDEVEARVDDPTRLMPTGLPAPNPPFVPYETDRTMTLRDLDAYVLSAEWTWRDLRLTGEYARQQTDIAVDYDEAMLPDERPHGDTEGWYVGASYRLLPKLEVGSYYAMYFADHRVQGRRRKQHYQEDIAFSVLYEVNAHWTLKAEYHAMQGTALLPIQDWRTADERWSLFALKTTFTF